MKPASKTNWPFGVIIGSSISIVLIILAIVAAWLSEINTQDGVYDVTAENAAMLGGLYLALPCGLLNIIVGIFARSRGLFEKGVAVIGFVIGGLGIVLGLLAWALFIAISSFVF